MGVDEKRLMGRTVLEEAMLDSAIEGPDKDHPTWDFTALERKRLQRLENSTKAMEVANAALRDKIGPVTDEERRVIDARLRALHTDEEAPPLPPPRHNRSNWTPVASRTALLKRIRAIVVTCPDKSAILSALDEMLDGLVEGDSR